MDFSSYHVGVFDSGLGGHYVALKLGHELPQIKVTALSDRENIPYGKKTPEELLACVTPFMARFENLEVDAIVIACNTCFINLEPQLRRLTKIPIIGFEPPLGEVARMTVSKSVVVCATGGTLRSRRWQALKAEQAADLKIIDVDCTDWVTLIEANKISTADLQPVVDEVVKNQADSLILGCTHYYWIQDKLFNLLPMGYRLKLYEPTQRVFKELKGILSELNKDSKK